jgi:hypothetical protein
MLTFLNDRKHNAVQLPSQTVTGAVCSLAVIFRLSHGPTRTRKFYRADAQAQLPPPPLESAWIQASSKAVDIIHILMPVWLQRLQDKRAGQKSPAICEVRTLVVFVTALMPDAMLHLALAMRCGGPELHSPHRRIRRAD